MCLLKACDADCYVAQFESQPIHHLCFIQTLLCKAAMRGRSRSEGLVSGKRFGNDLATPRIKL